MNVVDTSAAATPGSAAFGAPPARFVGSTRDYLALLARGAVLLAMTLGIYRFWLATDMRRFLWSNTEVAGERLEYTGTALELLIGFLIAMALLVPIYVGFFVVALNLGLYGRFAGALGFPFLAFLGHFAVYRARRYRLTRTVYRGIRGHQTGAAWRYAVCAMFWWVLIILTLGLAYPFAQSRLERYKMRHTYYGNLNGRFEGSGVRLFARGLVMWLLVVGPLAFALAFAIATVDWKKVAAAAGAADNGAAFVNQLEDAFPNVYTAIVVAIVAVGVSVAMAAVLFPMFQAMMLRWWIAGLRFGTLSVRSHLRTAQIYRAYLRFVLYGMLFLATVGILCGLVVGLGTTAAGLSLQKESMEIAGTIGGVVTYVVIMLGISTIYQVTVKLSLWRCGVQSIELEGASVLAQVRAEGAPSSAVGEGLADALNMGGF